MTSPKDIICLVDDDPSILRAMSRLLSSVGLQSRGFSAPREFIEYAKDHGLSLVVLDINMPEMTGLEIFDVLRERIPMPRVIFITGTHNSSCRGTVMSQGAEAFFTKPFKDEIFLAAVQTALNLSKDI